jgi:hypothetical protein
MYAPLQARIQHVRVTPEEQRCVMTLFNQLYTEVSETSSAAAAAAPALLVHLQPHVHHVLLQRPASAMRTAPRTPGGSTQTQAHNAATNRQTWFKTEACSRSLHISKNEFQCSTLVDYEVTCVSNCLQSRNFKL